MPGQFPSYGGQYHGYGAPEPVKTAADHGISEERHLYQRSRRRMNVVSVIATLLMPVLIFMTVFGLLSFHLHYANPGLCWFFVVVALLVVAVCGGVAWQTLQKRKAAQQSETWVLFLFGTSLVAWALALILGLYNYRTVMLPHYNVVTLNTYTNVDPGEIAGTGVMDAGRLSFKEGTFIDTSKAIGFKKVDTYCIAPVTSTKTPLLTYDFWAAGKNCCSGAPGDFHCGELNGHLQLGGGERILNDEEIPWLALAAQQAEAFYHIRVGHAIFFKNVADPLGEESTQMDGGVKFFCLWSLLFFGIHFFFSPAHSEKFFDMVIITSKDVLSLLGKVLLNLIKLLTVVSSHINELLPHGLDEILNVIVLLLERFHVFIILSSKLLHETLD